MVTHKFQTDSQIEEYNTLVSGLARVINSLQKVNDNVFGLSLLELREATAEAINEIRNNLNEAAAFRFQADRLIRAMDSLQKVNDTVSGLDFPGVRGAKRAADGAIREMRSLLRIPFVFEALPKSAETYLLPEPQPNTEANPLRWTVLPPGWWRDSEIVTRITESIRGDQEGRLVIERLRFIDDLKPIESYSSDVSYTRFGSRVYFVFVFEHHVVAECPAWGNAIYVIKGIHDWHDFLGHTKRQLLTIGGDRVIRLVHNGAWQSRLVSILKSKA